MGAIAAVLFNGLPADAALLRRMLASAPHRGPEVGIMEHGACVLGAASSPPADAWVTRRGSVAAVFTGVLDNAAELRRGLRSAPLSPDPNPAELFLDLFQEEGTLAPHRLRGVFAAVVTDGTVVWAFRDQLGFCPLYYRKEPGRLFVATEAKQVIAGAGVAREPDVEVLEQIFYGRQNDDAACALKGVQRLTRASLLQVNGDGPPKVHRYWHPERVLETARLAPPQVQEAFDTLMDQAVRRMLTGEDVLSLSGGIDSTAVAAFAAPAHLERTGRPLPALSMIYPDFPTVDETKYLAMVVETLPITLHTYRPTSRPMERLREWVAILDGPVPMIAIADLEENYRRARAMGFRTMLTGEIAEFVYDMHRHVLSHLLLHGRWGALGRAVRAERARGIPWKVLTRQLVQAFVPAPAALAYVRFRGRDWARMAPNWLDLGKLNEAPYRVDLQVSPRKRWREEQLRVFEGAGLTIEGDEMIATLCGIRPRRPISDVDLWEFFLSLPAETKYPDSRSKTLVRGLLRGRLPDAILDRRDKTVFDEYVMSRINYGAFRHFLTDPQARVPGVKYDILADRLRREDLTMIDYLWARDLVAIHAFLSLW